MKLPKLHGPCFCLAGTLMGGPAIASDFYDEPFLFRFIASLNRSVNYASTAAQQASVAAIRGSSVNPASAAAADGSVNEDRHDRATLTSINATSDSGAYIAALAGTAHYRNAAGNHISPAYAYTYTFDQQNRYDLETGLRSHEFFLEYARRLNNAAAIGIKGRFTHADIWHESPQATLGGTPARLSAESDSIDLAFGLLWKPSDIWQYGLTAGVSAGTTDSELKTLRNSMFLPAGSTLLALDDERFRSWSVRMGTGFVPVSSLELYGDAQWFGIESQSLGGLDIGLASLGGVWRINDSSAVRLGVTHDTEDKTVVAVGFRMELARDIPLDLAYQRNGAPEVRPEYGRVDLLTASIAFPL